MDGYIMVCQIRPNGCVKSKPLKECDAATQREAQRGG